MDEKLLAAVLTAPFVITMVGFAVAIAVAPAVAKRDRTGNRSRS
jgi:hypothetical protein